MDSNFENKKYKVVKKNGGETVIECLEIGKRFRRNVAHLKLLPTIPIKRNEISPIPGSSTNGQVETNALSGRKRKAPEKLNDFIC